MARKARDGRTGAVVAAVALVPVGCLGACGSGPATGQAVEERSVRLVCDDGAVQSAQVALEEGAGLPDPAAAVEAAQEEGWLPAGEASQDGGGRGVVVAGGVVVAAFLVEDVGGRWSVTSVDTCAG